jgi:uncharacterized membrane protein YdjX (TVP38/TMEM64 family)
MRHYTHATYRPALYAYLAAFAALGILYVYGLDVERFRPEAIRDLILSLGPFGPALYILSNIIRPFLLFPAAVLAVAGGLAFGPLWGTLYLVIGTVLGAALCFGIARVLGRERLRRCRPAWLPLAELDDRVAVDGFKTVLILRLAPVLPWDAVSFLAGLSGVAFRPYLAATFLGSIPGALAFSLCGDALFRSLPVAVAAATAIAAALFGLRYLYRRA